MRFGTVLSKKGGALKKLLLPFKLGLGGVFGSGEQYMSWVSIDDAVEMIQYNAVLHTLSSVANTTKELSRDTPYNS